MQPVLLFLFIATTIITPLNSCHHDGNKGGSMTGKTTNSTVQEKESRTPAQKKIDSQLLFAIYRKRGEAEAKGVPPGELLVKFDDEGRAIVSIRAKVTETVLEKIKSLDGKIISTSERYDDIRAHIALEKLEALAELKDVTAIMPAEESTNNARPQ
jgi:hypothetical protein